MTDRVKAVDEYLTACGIASEPCNDILFKQWSKLMVNDGLNQAAAAFDLPGLYVDTGSVHTIVRQSVRTKHVHFP